MARAFYIGVDGKARKAKKMYIGVDGKARKVKKIYAGVDGKAKLVFSDIPVSGFSLSVYNGTPSGSKGTASNLARATAKITPSDATDQTVTWKYTGATSRSGLSIYVSSSGNTCNVYGHYNSDDGYYSRTYELGTLTATLPNGMSRSISVYSIASSFKGSGNLNYACMAVSLG